MLVPESGWAAPSEADDGPPAAPLATKPLAAPAVVESPLAARSAGEPRILRFDIDALNLGPGSYSLTVALHTHSNHLAESYDWWERAAVFQVIPGSGAHFIGLTALNIKPELLPPGAAGGVLESIQEPA